MYKLHRLKDPAIVEIFQAVIGGKFAPLLATLDEDAETLTSSFNTVMTKAAEEALGKYSRKVQPWVTEEILDMCKTRRKLKKVKNTTGENEYKKVNIKIRKDMKRAKKEWIEKQCKEIEEAWEKTTVRRHIKSSRILRNKNSREQLPSRIKMVSV